MGSYAMDPGAPGKRLSTGKSKKQINMKCPKCGQVVQSQPGTNCGDCLMERVEIVPLQPVEG